MLNSKEHIRHCILYEYQLGHKADEAIRNICHAFGPGTISRSAVFDWFRRFDNGDYTLQDQPRPGRPPCIDLTELKTAIESDPTLSVANLANTLGCSQRNIYHHIKRLGFVYKTSNWSPHDLTKNQLEKRQEVCGELISFRRTFNWLDNLITGDEKWVLYINVKKKRHLLKPGQRPEPTPKAGLHPKKRMLCIWWSVRGVAYWELLPENTTITAASYCRQLQRLETELKDKLKWRGPVYFQHDNAKPHVAMVTKRTLERMNWILLPHPPYSPDLAPSDYHLFLSLSNQLIGKKFENEQDLKFFLKTFFDSKPQSFYAQGIYDLPRRWQEVVDTNGKYIIKK
jgi:histone-lysine N-methyltransferase SETMAR